MSSLITGLILIAIFLAAMVGFILWVRKEAKNLKKDKKQDIITKLKKLQ